MGAAEGSGSEIEPMENTMIALYYWYIQIPQKSLDPHSTFHKSICNDLNLFGRIRISKEGINGVLSGTKSNLEIYETKLRQEVEAATFTTSQDEARYGETLDVKYCHLRNDLQVEKQVFTSLSCKITQEVVSLNEPTAAEQQQKNRRRRRGKKKKNKGMGLHQETTEIDSKKDLLKSDKCANTDAMSERTSTAAAAAAADVNAQAAQNSISSNVKSQPINLDNYEPAQHLTPQEWNTQLMQDARNTLPDKGAILIDARNVYESNIGHFSVTNVPTLLTNTRKYSTIPSVLKASIPDLAGKNVYMYCTGGVRCERASVYLQALSESEEWPKDVEKPKAVYQLQGGIQKYLETYGKREEHDGSDDSQDAEKNTPTCTAQKESPCLFAGKNFVFDQRRYDPVVGRSDVEGVGKCVICNCYHDDYDNGHAPCENKEARCCRCRVLVLVCNDCRAKVRVEGEEVDDNANETTKKPDLFCGDAQCINEGNEIQHCELRRCNS
jgi:predicted sulfurtransferase